MTPPLLFDLRGKRVYVAGHNGMVGSAIMRRLANEGCEILAADRRTLDLTNQKSTEDWLAQMRPDAVFLAVGLVGGIYANNTYPADFIAKNLAIALNVIRGAHAFGVKKLLALGSSCIYPKFAPQPMTEDALLTGPLEPTNEWYAVAKIAARVVGLICLLGHWADTGPISRASNYAIWKWDCRPNWHGQRFPSGSKRRVKQARNAARPSARIARIRRDWYSLSVRARCSAARLSEIAAATIGLRAVQGPLHR